MEKANEKDREREKGGGGKALNTVTSCASLPSVPQKDSQHNLSFIPADHLTTYITSLLAWGKSTPKIKLIYCISVQRCIMFTSQLCAFLTTAVQCFVFIVEQMV